MMLIFAMTSAGCETETFAKMNFVSPVFTSRAKDWGHEVHPRLVAHEAPRPSLRPKMNIMSPNLNPMLTLMA